MQRGIEVSFRVAIESGHPEPIATITAQVATYAKSAVFANVRRRSAWRFVLSALLFFSGYTTLAATSASEAAAFHSTIVRAIGSHLSSLGIEERYWPVASQLEPLASSSEAAPDLSVEGLYWDDLRATLYFRLGCAKQETCAPFLVRANVPAETANLLRQWFRPSVQSKNFAASSNIRKANRCQQPSLLVHSGRAATLLLRRENMRLTAPVIVLDCGMAGQRVRARGKKTNKLFDAEVIGENLLAATF